MKIPYLAGNRQAAGPHRSIGARQEVPRSVASRYRLKASPSRSAPTSREAAAVESGVPLISQRAGEKKRKIRMQDHRRSLNRHLERPVSAPAPQLVDEGMATTPSYIDPPDGSALGGQTTQRSPPVQGQFPRAHLRTGRAVDSHHQQARFTWGPWGTGLAPSRVVGFRTSVVATADGAAETSVLGFPSTRCPARVRALPVRAAWPPGLSARTVPSLRWPPSGAASLLKAGIAAV